VFIVIGDDCWARNRLLFDENEEGDSITVEISNCA
jgi:hypothetical protein